MIDDMKHSRASVMVVLVAALAASIQSIAAPDCVMGDSAALEDLSSQPSPITVKKDAVSSPAVVPSASASSADVGDVPSISGLYSIGGRTLVPYVGAGFSGGYSSDFSRSLNRPPPAQNDLGLRSQFGQTLSPNEFQLGVRIPF
jgi:hypothetical protein